MLCRCCSDCALVIMAFNVEDQSEDSLKCFPTLPRLQHEASEYQPCWFVSVIRRIHQYMKVVIPAEFSPSIFAPSEMMVTVNNGKCSYIVEVENQQLTKGWYTVALNHKLGKNYTMLFASVRPHVFELFIFDEEGSWVKHELINNGLDSQIHGSVAVIMNADERSFVTSYLPAPFQASSSEHQFCRTVRKADLKEMELPNMFKAVANVSDVQQVTLITKARTWKVKCVHGYLKGEGWSNFVAAHRLISGNLLIFSFEMRFGWHVLIFSKSGCERMYSWY
ncbi:hypothetical protein Vadar_007662 [Vaccinium darrowii]|uniref:Uncharacterized protein n=1 Tax=Vaccinium darrowii TaxID=229202 RepID=A0ACB7Y6T9_9ERIC|nr:hypothetical protein Vadar_007662 [Vaccinium darrowii]